MNIPKWLKPAVFGAIAGGIALTIVGFSWGGWVTGGSAASMASDLAETEVVAALVPICIQQSQQDPKFATAWAEISEASSYKARDMVMEAGWATMPETEKPNRDVATACVKELTARYSSGG